MAHAICRHIEPSIFFPEHEDLTKREQMDANETAKRICHSCPVRLACLDDAMFHERVDRDRYGIWGGTTPSQRCDIAAQRQRNRVA